MSKAWLDWRETNFAAIQKMEGLVKLKHKACVKTSQQVTTPLPCFDLSSVPHLHARRN